MVEFTDIPKDVKNNPKYTHLCFNRCLKITIYGDPIADSRPRVNMDTGAVAVINLQKLRKRLLPIYENSILERITVTSPYVLMLETYHNPTVKLKGVIKKNNTFKKLFEKEYLFNIARKDVDNMVKVHNDVLMCPEFRICLDDAWCVGVTGSNKVLTDGEPKSILYIIYSTKPHKFYADQITSSATYYKWLISLKYMKMNDMSILAFKSHLRKTFRSFFDPKKVSEILKRTVDVIKEYPSDISKELAGMSEGGFVKADAQYKILLDMSYGKKEVKEYIDEIKRNFSVEENDNINDEFNYY